MDDKFSEWFENHRDEIYGMEDTEQIAFAAWQAALEEAAQIADDCEYEATLESEENGFRSAMEVIASKIRALISGAGNHASQQPHAVDLASAPLRPNH